MSSNFGAVAVGIRAADGVVLAADRRLSYGGFVFSRNARKTFIIDNRIGIALAGFYGDISGLKRMLEAEVSLYELAYDRKLSVRALAKRLSTILYSHKFFPFMVEALVGGIDDGIPRLFVLDPVGSITEEKFAAAGSGAQMALGVLENMYKDDIRVDEAKEIAFKAIKSAIMRDATSGDGIEIVTISADKGASIMVKELRLVESGRV